MRRRVVRIDGDHLAVGRDRVLRRADARAHDREVEERRGHPRVLLEREPVVRLGRRQPVLALRDLTEVVEGEFVLGVLGERLEVRRDRFVEASGRVRRQPAVQRIGGAGRAGTGAPGSAAGGGERGSEDQRDETGVHSGGW